MKLGSAEILKDCILAEEHIQCEIQLSDMLDRCFSKDQAEQHSILEFIHEERCTCLHLVVMYNPSIINAIDPILTDKTSSYNIKKAEATRLIKDTNQIKKCYDLYKEMKILLKSTLLGIKIPAKMFPVKEELARICSNMSMVEVKLGYYIEVIEYNSCYCY